MACKGRYGEALLAAVGKIDVRRDTPTFCQLLLEEDGLKPSLVSERPPSKQLCDEALTPQGCGFQAPSFPTYVRKF
jgi:hypothetical protein